MGEPSILHYPYSGYERFREKHHSLGEFDTETFRGESWRAPQLLSAAQRCIKDKDILGLRRLYDTWVVLGDTNTRNALAGAGILRTISFPREVIARMNSSRILD